MTWLAVWTFISRLSPTVLIVGAVVLFYEGLPLGPVRSVPWLGPALSQFVDGRVDRERAAGALSERLVWQENMRRALAKQQAEAAKKQADIDAIAADYANRRNADQVTIDALEQALAEERKEGRNHENADAGDRRFISRRVSNRLDAIGR